MCDEDSTCRSYGLKHHATSGVDMDLLDKEGNGNAKMGKKKENPIKSFCKLWDCASPIGGLELGWTVTNK